MKMITEKTFKNMLIIIFILTLFILTLIIIRPIAMSIFTGIILAYIFNPLYRYINSIIKEKNLSAFFICILALLIIFIPLWFLTPILIQQTFNVYTYMQNLDLFSVLRQTLPSIFSSEQLSRELVVVINNFISKSISALLNNLTGIITNFPNLLLQLAIVLFTFFFSLRDSDKFLGYVKSLLPLSKESEKQFFEQSKALTNSVIYGQAIIGIVQGILAGIGFYVFGVSNAAILTLIAVFVSILPIIGPWLVWLPVSISLLVAGDTANGVGLIVYGLFIVSSVDNFIRPYIISKKTKLPTSIALIGMIGGLLVFGILGMIIGPLILAYLLIVLDFYREKRFSSLFIES